MISEERRPPRWMSDYEMGDSEEDKSSDGESEQVEDGNREMRQSRRELHPPRWMSACEMGDSEE